MGAVNHHPAGRHALSLKVSEDAVEDAHTGPANEPVVKRLVGSIGLRRIPPSQTISDNMDYPTDDTEVVHTRNPTRLRKAGDYTLQLDPGGPELIGHRQILLPRLKHDATSDGIQLFSQDSLCGRSLRL